MIRNLKALGLALVAVCAMGALAASSASAVDTFTKTGGGTAYVTGTSHNNKFELAGGTNFQCTTSKFVGTFTNGSNQVTVDPEYIGLKDATPHTNHECTSSGGNVTIDMNGCHFVLTGNTTGSDPAGTVDATVWITCPVNKSITITTNAGITYHIPAQTPTIGGVTYKTLANHPGGSAVEVTATATGITYTCTGGFACHFAGGTHGTAAKYTGSVIVTGYQDLGPLSPLTPITEGAQVPISVSTS